MPCQAPPFSRVATCPGPTGMPAAARCPRCARGACLAAGERFRANCPGPGGTPAANICPECRARGNLRDRRGSMAAFLQQPGVTGAQLQKGWTTRVEAIVQQMFVDAFAGNEPCQYAFCIAGSGARHEASPYSDLDCFLLLADDSPSNVLFFRTATKAVSDMLIALDFGSGLRLCNLMSPLGCPGDPTAPELMRTPHEMADLLEWPDSRANGHVKGGLMENRFLFGTQKLHTDFLTDLNLIVNESCFTFSSRLTITRGKTMGLDTLKKLLNDREYAPPQKTDGWFHVKNQFYRPPQFIAKALSWFYGVQAVNTLQQLDALVLGNHMSPSVANNFRPILDVMAKLRFKLHLDREGEKDFVFTSTAARDAELQRLNALPQLTTADREMQTRLKQGTLLTAAERADLVAVIPNLHYIMRLAATFVKEKEKLLGKRANPFVA